MKHRTKKVQAGLIIRLSLTIALAWFYVPTGICEEVRLDSVKLLVEHDRMYRLTGKDIAMAVEQCNTMPVTENRLGKEIFNERNAARDGDYETAHPVGFGGMGKVEVTGVESEQQPGKVGAGRYCIKVETTSTDAEIRNGRARFKLEGGKRYKLSCKIYATSPGRSFEIGFVSSLSGYSGTARVGGGYRRNAVSAQPGEWIEVSGLAVLPDTGEHECYLWIRCQEKGPDVWYLDDVSVREVESVEVRNAFREKTAVEKDFELSQVSALRMNLYNEGQSVPIIVENAGPDGVLTAQTSITFWGESPRGISSRRSLVTKENAYVLAFDSPDAPNRYQLTTVLPRPAKGVPVTTTVMKTAHLEKNSTLDRERFVGPATDYSMWLRCWSYAKTELHLEPLHDLAPGHQPKTIRMSLWGRSHLPVNPDHDWRIFLNENDIGGAVWDGRTNHLFISHTVADHFQANEENVIRLASSRQGLGIDGIALDWIEVDYEASLSPREDFLDYSLDSTVENRSVRLTGGFSGSPIRVFDRNGGVELQVQPLADTETGQFFSEYVYSFEESPGRFRAVGPHGFLKPERILTGYESRLKGIAAVPEYLVITHRYFRNAVEPLLVHRARQGLRVMAVDVEDIYDEYSHGMFSPKAIRLFLDDLLDRSVPGESGLRYVFFVGDATYDYLDVNQGQPNLVPTYHTEQGSISEYTPLVAQDDYFVYGASGGTTPLVAVGRLPCDRIDTVENYLEKVLEYESDRATDVDPWVRTALLIDGWDFSYLTARLESEVLADWEVERISSTGDTAKDKGHQARIVAALNRGCSLVNFVGHGSNYVWNTAAPAGSPGAELFTRDHLKLLHNAGMYPIVFSATCFSALYDEPSRVGGPGMSGIGVFFVESKKRGAIALIGHVGKASIHESQAFNSAVMQRLANGFGQRLGDALLAAKHQFGGARYSGITLLGDPALLVRPYFGGRTDAASAKTELDNS